jgi:hypothetical protein
MIADFAPLVPDELLPRSVQVLSIAHPSISDRTNEATDPTRLVRDALAR